jgi:hypothetical protein
MCNPGGCEFYPPLPNEDHTGSFLLSAMGMFLEGLSPAAAEPGFRMDAVLPHSAAWYAERISDKDFKGLTLFSGLRLIRDAGAAALYAPALLLIRRRSRISLRRDPAPQESVDELLMTELRGNDPGGVGVVPDSGKAD